jgi:archaellum biogenesis ATPase FlaH
MSDVKIYNKDIEELFIQFFITDPELFVRCMGILSPKHFKDPQNKACVEFIKSHAEAHSALPTVEQIKAISGKTLLKLTDVTENHKDWFLNEFEQFSIHRELESIIYSGPDLLEEGRYGEILSKVKDALSMGLVKDLGTNYFSDPKSRLEEILKSGGGISTGLTTIDEKLFGGFNRGELNIFAGQSGAGKSIFLQNLAVNWAAMGLNVIYLSLELSEKLCSMRIDAMTTGIATTDIMKNIDDVSMRVIMFHKKNKGSLQIKQLKNGCTANDIRAYVKEYEIHTGIKVDAILVDYLDLCMPYSVKVSPSDQFVKDKYVSEELRNLAIELDVLLATASQLNRGSYDTIEFDPSSIAGGISKVNSSDNVMGIFTTATMKQNGRYQLQFMKTRSSSGVGSKIDLGFDNKTLKLYDLKDGDDSSIAKQTTAILNNVSQNISDVKTNKAPIATAQANVRGLRDILKDISDD